MARDEPNALDDQFAELLAEYHEGLVSGRSATAENGKAEVLDPTLQTRLTEARQCLNVIEHLRRRGGPTSPLAPCADAPPNFDLSTSSHTPDEPRTIGRFQIVRELGRGGYGVVFLARDPLLRREVALKVPRPDALVTPNLRHRFLREAQAAARLTHPNVVALHEVGEVGPICFIAAAYCDGPTLAAWLRDGAQPASPRLAAQVVAALADAVHYAHTQGVLHRDLKPSNVLLESKLAAADGEGTDELPFVPKLTDFGLAKLAENDAQESHTRTGAMLGTPAYMAPEQADGRLDDVGPRTDVYALGAMLYEMLTGRPVFRGSTDLDTMHRVVVDEPVPPRKLRPDLPADLEAICLKCLEKTPDRRYGTAAALDEDLRRFLAGEATEARPLSCAGKLWKWSRRRPATAALVAVSVVAATTIVVVSLWYSARLRTALVAADQQREIAEGARHESEQSRLATLAQEEITNEFLYASRMKLTYQGLAQGDISQAAGLLAEYVDGSRFSHLRGFEWHYAERAMHEERLTLVGHEEAYGVAFSPDGRTLATSGKDGTVMLWDPASGRGQLMPTKHEGCVNQVAFSPDGSLLATASCDGSVKLFAVADRLELPIESEPSGKVLCLAFSPDSKWLVAGGTNRRTSIVLVAERREVDPLKNESVGVNSLAFSPDGRVLAAADHEPGGRPSLSLWEVGTWQRRASNAVPASTVAFSPDSKTLAAGDFSGLVRLFDVATAQQRLTLRGHSAPVQSIAFSPDGKRLASGSDDRTVRVWNRLDGRDAQKPVAHDVAPGSHATTKEPRRTARVYAGHADRVQGLAFAPDGQTLASASLDGTIKLWGVTSLGSDAPVLRVDKAFVPDQSPMDLSADLRYLALIKADARIRILDVSNSRTVRETDAASGYARFVLSPDGTMLAAINATEPTVTLSRFPSLDPIGTFPRGAILPASIVLSSDARVMASADLDGFVRVRAIPDGREAYSVQVYKQGDVPGLNGVRLALSNDGRTLAIGNVNHERGLVDLATLECRPLPIDSHQVHLMAFSPDDRLLAVASDDRAVRVIDRGTGKLAYILRPSALVCSLAFSADSRTLATAIVDGPVVLWHVATGLQMAVFEELPGDARALRFARDGRSLAAFVELPDHAGSELYVLSAAGKP